MDQFISCHGRRGHALMLDCRTLQYDLLPLPENVRLVICNTMVKHELAGGEYNRRRAECEEGVRILSQYLPGIKLLRDVSPAELDRWQSKLPDTIARRCRHVVTEDERVKEAASMLQRGDLNGFGSLMAASHASLRDDYEVSCPELDTMVALAHQLDGLIGARMTGGGFGGCTINLVEAAVADVFATRIAGAYETATGIQPEIYVATAADGACEVG